MVCLLFVLIALTAGFAPTGTQAEPQAGVQRAALVSAVSPASAVSASPIPTPAVIMQSSAQSSKPKLSKADKRAGLRSLKVPWTASGKLRTVPGKSKAPGKKGRIYTIRIRVEKGLDVNGPAFAAFVMSTLNDKRSWTEHGRRRFARTAASNADITVVLASPATSEKLCRPLGTHGKLSCRVGRNAVLTYYRWVKAMSGYAKDHEGYRHYVVNHEVGHALGHRHEYCAGKGKRAPVMMQQTKGLRGCRPNPWPHP